MFSSLSGRTLPKTAYRILGLTMILASFSAFVWVLGDAVRSTEGLKPDRWAPLIAAAVLHCFMLLFLMVLWERVLAIFQASSDSPRPNRTSKSTLYTAYSRSWLARYIPGRIWSMAGRTILVSKLGVSKDQVTRSIIVEVVLAYGMLTIISIALLTWVYLHPIFAVITFAVSVFFFGSALIKTRSFSAKRTLQNIRIPLAHMVFQRAARILFGGTYISRNTTLKGLGLYGAYSFMQLAFIVLIAASFADLTASKIAVIAGAWGLSLTVGWLSILPPAGLGARDGLAFILFSQGVGLPAASSIVLASRLVMLMTDLAFVLAVESTTKINLQSALFKIPFMKISRLKT